VISDFTITEKSKRHIILLSQKLDATWFLAFIFEKNQLTCPI